MLSTKLPFHKINFKQLFLTLSVFLWCVACHANELIPSSIIHSLKQGYSQIEQENIEKDLQEIRQKIFKGITTESTPDYIGTAGGPGASKTTILEQKINKHQVIDPDQILKLMTHTYLQDISLNHGGEEKPMSGKEAYEKWRNASNYIANSLLNEAFANHYPVFHGTTATGEKIKNFYSSLKSQGYRIVLYLCYSTPENRIAAIHHRNNIEGFFQVTTEDIRQKGIWFPERFPVYFDYADELHFFWTDSFTKGSDYVASMHRGKDVVILNKGAFQSFSDQYKKDTQGKSLPSLEALIQSFKGAA